LDSLHVLAIEDEVRMRNIVGLNSIQNCLLFALYKQNLSKVKFWAQV